MPLRRIARMFSLRNPADPLESLVQTMDRYFRRDPILEANSYLIRRQAELNEWAETSIKHLRVLNEELDSQISELNDIRAEIEHADQRLAMASPGMRASLLSARNLLIEKHNLLAASFGENKRNYNALVQTHNRESEHRQTEL